MKKLKIIFIFAILLFANVLLLEKVPAPAFCTWNSDCPPGKICDPQGGGGICVSSPSSCTQSSDCATQEYCSSVDNNCYTLPTCGMANIGYDYTYQISSKDFYNDCSILGSCNNQYTRTTHNGLCSGSGYSCQSSTVGVTTGDVCHSGNSVAPSGGFNCGIGSQACYCDNDYKQCDVINDCTHDQYYVGFTGSGTCTETGKVLRASNVLNTDPDRCKIGSTTAYQSASSVYDQNTCSSNSYCTSGVCTNQCPTLATNKFIVKNSIGSSCLEVDTSGNALIHGVLTQSCSTAPPIDSFILKFGTNVRGWVRGSNCDMCLYATVSTSQSITFAAPDGFYVKNSGGTYVMKLDTSGILKFAGNACYGYDSGAATKL